MKKIFFTTTFFLLVGIVSSQIYVDSTKIFHTNDTTYYLGIYGVLMPSGPCEIIDSSKYITQDTIGIHLCYLYGDAASILCRGKDTIYLGNLNNSSYTIIVYLASTDTINNSCNNPFKKDTIEFTYITTGIDELSLNSLVLSPNPATSALTIQTITTGKLNYQILTIEGKQLTQPVPIIQTNTEININTLPAGLYFLILQDEKTRAVKKFIKE